MGTTELMTGTISPAPEPDTTAMGAVEGGWQERAEAAEARLAEVAAYVRQRKGDAGFSWLHALDILAITGTAEEADRG